MSNIEGCKRWKIIKKTNRDNIRPAEQFAFEDLSFLPLALALKRSLPFQLIRICIHTSSFATPTIWSTSKDSLIMNVSSNSGREEHLLQYEIARSSFFS